MLVTSAMRFEEAPDVMTPLRYVWPGGKIYPAFEAVGAREPCLGVVEGMPEELARRGPKMAPRQPQDGPKTTSERPQDGPKTAEANSSRCGKPSKAPRWPQDGSKMAQDGPKNGPSSPKMSSKMAYMAPRWPQDGSKMAYLPS